MANVVKNPEEKNIPTQPQVHYGSGVEKFWIQNNKIILYVVAGIILLVSAYFIYQSFVVAPEEQKASEAIWKAEDYYRRDSARLALNGDGPNAGFLKIISKYGGTKTGKLAKFYAASCYMKMNDYNNAIKYLKDFTTSDKMVSVRATGLLGDAYAEAGKKADAAEEYHKAGTMYPDDSFNSPEYLFRAGLLYQELNKNKEAVESFKIIKDKYASSERGVEIDKYLSRLGSFE